MKINYALAALLACGTLSATRPDNKFDLRSQQILITEYNANPSRPCAPALDRDAADTATLRAIVTLDDADNAGQLTEAGIKVFTTIGTRAMVQLTPAQVETLQQMDCVTLISLARPVKVDNDLMRAAGNVDAVHRGEYGLDKAYDGTGVLVALYDSGLQPNHLNFLNSDGTSRVKRMYTYNMGQDMSGNATVVEREYKTPDEISTFTTEDRDGTHGTHVLGIAAGSYTDCDKDYSGVAPGADIAIACGWTDDVAILTGLKRLIEYAGQNNQPVVINLSLGDIMGPHDGTDSFAAALDELAETTPLVISSGNSGDLGLALTKTLNDAGDNRVRTTLAGNAALAALNKGLKGQRWDAQGTYEIYASDNRPFTIEVGIIDKNTGEMLYAVPVEAGSGAYVSTAGGAGQLTSEFLNEYYTNSYISVMTGVAENNRYLATVNLSLLKKAPFNNNIMPAIIITGAGGTQRIDMHTNSNYNYFAASGLEGWDDATVDGSNNNLTCGRNVIGVGAYTTRITEPYMFGELGTVAPFSGSATLVDGTDRPHVCAPGHALISSMSSYFRQSSAYSRKDFPIAYETRKGDLSYYWVPMSGTSMAAPVVTGTIALWLQANGELTPAEIKKIAMETAQAPAEPSTRWGAGRIDALAGLKKVLTSSVSEVSADASEAIIERAGDTFRVIMPGTSAFTAELYNMSGMRVATAGATDGEAVINVAGIAPGVYLLRAGNTARRVVR